VSLVNEIIFTFDPRCVEMGDGRSMKDWVYPHSIPTNGPSLGFYHRGTPRDSGAVRVDHRTGTDSERDPLAAVLGLVTSRVVVHVGRYQRGNRTRRNWGSELRH